MTKLVSWICSLVLLGSTWAALIMGLTLGLELHFTCQEVLWPLSAYLIVTTGCFALGTVGFHVATFHDYEDKALELQTQIQEAPVDLVRRGLRF
ncbi:PREDICTED: dolichol-phosphate mannosyltransferase subunit 3-like [Elephantulus edwardii]|uniref:dolichol-phosphate mannosyltransferase subunit 3-like n=1 Tax=Elephantulus edwardii TaxID=28737 RepID=UPI0003F0B202|nr:PREDICTED: dolichol-phosphate mannosyltransferase subunit 3-like [Elephantulus edwardii]